MNKILEMIYDAIDWVYAAIDPEFKHSKCWTLTKTGEFHREWKW